MNIDLNSNKGMFVFPSYQQQQQQQQPHQEDGIAISSSSPASGSFSTPGKSVVGPGVSKILQKQRELENHHHVVNGQEIKLRRTRMCYLFLGIILLIVYLILVKKHFFEHHPIPSFTTTTTSDDGDDDYVDNNSGSGSSSSSMSAQLVVDMEGKSKHHKKKKHKKGLLERDQSCANGDYSKHTLKPAYDLPFAALFKETKGQKKYEASDIIVVDGEAYAVCDNSWAISKFGDDLTPFSPGNKQIGDPSREEEDSGYEALFEDSGTFYVLRESILHEEEGSYHAIIEELSMGDDDYDVTTSCSAEFEFEGDSKGFEGVISLKDTSNELVVMGLCEGNHCSESQKFDTGNGVFVAMKKTMMDDGSCQWSTIQKVKIPPTANFKDYSAATIDATGRVAVSSQEDSAIWIGQLKGLDEVTGLWDLEALEFDPDVGEVFTFPKNNNCETIYCNIEGIHWINTEMIIAVSDKMKSKGKQDFRCFDKDQSVHVFVLP